MLGTVGCGESRPEFQNQLYTFQGSTMGTGYSVKVVEPPERELSPEVQEALSALIEDELDQVDRRMSTYRDDSELSRFNASRSVEPFPLSPETVEVLAAAFDIGKRTDGALDITIGPLVNAWGFGPDLEEPPVLEDDRLRELRAQVGLEHLALDVASGTLTKALPELFVDLSSLAKGYAVDRVLAAIRAEGHQDVMVEVGGEVRASGVNLAGRPWRLGIERPDGMPGQVQRIVELDDRALATSGDYRNYRERDGVRLSHLIDPRTGRPVEHRLASVSVITESGCMEADALATAFMILGAEEGLALAEREKIAALFLVRDDEGFREEPSSAFREVHMPATGAAP